MHIVKTIAQVRKYIATWRAAGERIALVPTMGNLHRGHIDLFDNATKHADKVAVSIFVNPMQFDREDDLRLYPRTLEEDLKKLRNHSVDLVFIPTYEEMYPPFSHSSIRVEPYIDPGDLGKILCGADRPGHFSGVATVVMKLFNIFTADIAVFGEKDYQQLVLIKRLVERFDLDIRIVSVSTAREESGLAMSSRNNSLDKEQKQRAAMLYRVLYKTAVSIKKNSDVALDYLIKDAHRQLESAGLRPDYVAIRDRHGLLPLNDQRKVKDEAVVLGAVWLGKARLIDSVVIDERL